MGECKAETTAHLVSTVVDCLTELAERVKGNTLGEVAVGQMQFYCEWLVGIEIDKQEADAA